MVTVRRAGTSTSRRTRTLSFAGSGRSLSRLGRLGLYGSHRPSIVSGQPFAGPQALPGLFQWIDAYQGITQAAGAVSQWNDLSGGDRHFVQGTGTNQPTYSATGWDASRPAVTFDGTSDIMFASGASIYAAAGSTMYFLFRPIVLAVSACFWSEGDPTNTITRASLYSSNPTSSLGYIIRNDANVTTFNGALASGVFTAGTAVLIAISDTGSAFKVRVNGIAQAIVPYTRSGVFTVTRTNLGGQSTSGGLSAFFNAAYAEAATYRAVHTQAQMEQMEGYLAWKWGLTSLLPASHPFKSVSPMFLTFDPRYHMADLIAWYDPTDGASMAQAGGKVSQINDKSTSGFHLVQGTGAAQPAVNSAVIPGKTVIEFNGAQYMQSNGGLSIGNGGGLSAIVSGYTNITPSNNARLLTLIKAATSTDNDVNGFLCSRFATGSNSIVAMTSAALFTVNTFTVAAWFLHSSDRNASAIRSWLNGAAPKNVALSDALAVLDRVLIGTSWSGGVPSNAYLTGYLSIITLFGVVLSDPNRQRAEGFAAWYTGQQALLDAAHPYRNSPPIPLGPVNSIAPVISADGPYWEVGRTFTCTTGTWTGASSYAYQWLRNGVRIAGATSSTYLTVAADSGQTLSCLVTAIGANGVTLLASNSGRVNWSPLAGDIAGLLAYFNPSIPSSVTQSLGAVSQINDLSGNNRHLTQATGANQPLANAADATLGNKQTLSFSSHFLNNTGQSITVAKSTSLVVMCPDYTVMVNGARFFSTSLNAQADSGSDKILLASCSGGGNSFGGATATGIAAVGIAQNEWHSLMVVRDDATQSANRDGGAATASGTPGAANASPVTRMCMGTNLSGSNPGTQYFIGKGALVVWYSGILSAADQAKVQGWAHWATGLQSLLPSGHTYASAPP